MYTTTGSLINKKPLTGIVLFLQAFFVTAFFPAGLVAVAKTFSREMRSLATGIILAVSTGSGGESSLTSLEYPVTQSVSD